MKTSGRPALRIAAITTMIRSRPDYRGERVWLIKVTCPHCGRTHHHGGGSSEIPDLGLRVADCGGPGYVIAEAPS